MAQSRQTSGQSAAQEARRPWQIIATPLTAEQTEQEHAASELAIARVEAAAGLDGWGEISHGRYCHLDAPHYTLLSGYP